MKKSAVHTAIVIHIVWITAIDNIIQMWYNKAKKRVLKGGIALVRGITTEIANEIRKRKGLEDTKLHKARMKKGMSQVDLSKASGVALATIQGYEAKNRDINGAKLETLCDIAKALDCNISDIIDDNVLIKKFNAVTKGGRNA